jgi:hypothetical protein
VFHADIGRVEYLRLMWEDCRFNLGKDHTMDEWLIHKLMKCVLMYEYMSRRSTRYVDNDGSIALP